MTEPQLWGTRLCREPGVSGGKTAALPALTMLPLTPADHTPFLPLRLIPGLPLASQQWVVRELDTDTWAAMHRCPSATCVLGMCMSCSSLHGARVRGRASPPLMCSPHSRGSGLPCTYSKNSGTSLGTCFILWGSQRAHSAMQNALIFTRTSGVCHHPPHPCSTVLLALSHPCCGPPWPLPAPSGADGQPGS